MDAAGRGSQAVADPAGAARTPSVSYTPDDKVATSTQTDPPGRTWIPGRGGGRAALKDDAAYADLPDMLALAKLSNVGVKLSGAPSTSSHPYPYKNIHGYLRQIVEASS